jgi:hypothetical protein
MTTRRATTIAAALLTLALTAVAAAERRGDDEVRVRKPCLDGTAELRLRARDEGDDRGTIDVELRIDTRGAYAWGLVVLHERTLVYQRTRGAARSVRYRRSIPDWPGRETISVRATVPTGRACRLAAPI